MALDISACHANDSYWERLFIGDGETLNSAAQRSRPGPYSLLAARLHRLRFLHEDVRRRVLQSVGKRLMRLKRDRSSFVITPLILFETT